MRPRVETFLHDDTETFSHVVYDAAGGHAAVIDPVLDFDHASGRTATEHADRIVAFVRGKNLTVDWVLETHAHADHLSAAPYLCERLGGRVAIGEHIRDVQAIFSKVFNLDKTFSPDGRDFDHLFADGDSFRIGSLEGRVMHTPGHTPADVSYLIGDAVFVGDTLFMPDLGTARCDFPGGDARTLYRSTQRLLALPEDTRMFLCHDYPPTGRSYQAVTTVGEQRRGNIHVGEAYDEAAFVKRREARDATLTMPRLILPSIQVNIRAGKMPPADDNGTVYLKLPVDRF